MNKILKALKSMGKQSQEFKVPSVTEISLSKDPYRILISCILSLRTKDKTTSEASQRLFKVAANPDNMVKLTPLRLQRLIYPVGFYRNKTRAILEISKRIVADFSGRVPDNLGDLLIRRRLSPALQGGDKGAAQS